MLNTEKVLWDASNKEGNVETQANFLGTLRNENNHLLTQPTEGWCCLPNCWFLSLTQRLTETRPAISLIRQIPQPPVGDMTVTSILQVRKVLLREVK